MGIPVVFMPIGGVAVTISGNGYGLGIEEATFGTGVTIVDAGGLPVVNMTPPQALTEFAVTGGTLHLGHAPLSFTTADDIHLASIAIYRAPTGVALDKAAHFVHRIEGVSPSSTFAYVDGDDTPTNLFLTPDFATDTNWTKGTGWTIGSGVASGAAGTLSGITQPLVPDVGGTYRFAADVVLSAGGVAARFTAAGGVTGTFRTTTGKLLDKIVGITGNLSSGFQKDASFVGSIDNAVMFKETVTCAPQGDWDYYAIPENQSGIEGPQAAKLDIVIV